jgi:hypothetical protein
VSQIREEKVKMNERAKRICRLASGLVVVALVVTGAMLVVGTATAPSVRAWGTLPPCDFLTGGGWIVHNGAKANFGVGGGCKHGSPTWGHLEYIDHGTGLNVHWTSITGYFFWDDGSNGTDSKTGQPIGTRKICGTARTNQFGDVNFAVRARDAGEPGVNDQFDIILTDSTGAVVYNTASECTWHYLGSYAPCAAGNGGGGNIQLHKPNPSTSGSFGGSCPAFPGF